MTDKMIKTTHDLCEAINAFEEAFREALAAYGIKTTENYITLKQNKKLLKQLHKAEMKDIQDLAVLVFSKCSGIVH